MIIDPVKENKKLKLQFDLLFAATICSTAIPDDIELYKYVDV